MATEVVHGPAPTFHAPANMREFFFCTIVGHYTDTPNLAAAGVTEHRYQSDRPAKRQPELLALRTAFMNWFVQEWLAAGGSEEEALHHLSYAERISGYGYSQDTTRPVV